MPEPETAEEDDPVVTWAHVRKMANLAATEAGEWAGAPLPVDHLKLVIEPGYPFQLNGMTTTPETETTSADDDEQETIRNVWYSERLRGDVYVFEANGVLGHIVIPADTPAKRIDFLINTIGGSRAWDFNAELKALGKLRALLEQYAWERYMLTGTFLETSDRSGVTYVFRRLRPTLAMKADPSNRLRVLAALCLHPIGYYHDSFAGVMVPTDDVIAHLLLMRADEHRFWKKANHHRLRDPRAGV